MYIEVPIIGSGAVDDKYRAAVRVPTSAVIPSDKDGKPKFTTTIVWIDDKHETEVDRSIRRIPLQEARQLAKQMDPTANLNRLEQQRELHRTR
jgi:hypothetical protein